MKLCYCDYCDESPILELNVVEEKPILECGAKMESELWLGKRGFWYNIAKLLPKKLIYNATVIAIEILHKRSVQVIDLSLWEFLDNLRELFKISKVRQLKIIESEVDEVDEVEIQEGIKPIKVNGPVKIWGQKTVRRGEQDGTTRE